MTKNKPFTVLTLLTIGGIYVFSTIFIEHKDKAAIESYKNTTEIDFALMNCSPLGAATSKTTNIYKAPLNGSSFQLISIHRDIYFKYTAIFRAGPLPGSYFSCN
ncbi:hypothetical protein [Aquabacterium parvum]|uniref:hypothetical protein n=1 Tax=Aquabacterium parvum TaxID=70584 RepID=UPI00128F0221|nr:hypothetical protein [Aquabacterium parvum]